MNQLLNSIFLTRSFCVGVSPTRSCLSRIYCSRIICQSVAFLLSALSVLALGFSEANILWLGLGLLKCCLERISHLRSSSLLSILALGFSETNILGQWWYQSVLSAIFTIFLNRMIYSEMICTVCIIFKV